MLNVRAAIQKDRAETVADTDTVSSRRVRTDVVRLAETQLSRSFEGQDRTDVVLARRVWREVLGICEPMLTKTLQVEERFWILASAWEATVGLGDNILGSVQDRDEQMSPAPWMLASTEDSLSRLRSVLADPDWVDR